MKTFNDFFYKGLFKCFSEMDSTKFSALIEVELSNIWKQKPQEIKITMADLQDKEKNNEMGVKSENI